MLIYNSARDDPRVVAEGAALARNGYRVSVIGAALQPTSRRALHFARWTYGSPQLQAAGIHIYGSVLCGAGCGATYMIWAMAVAAAVGLPWSILTCGVCAWA